MIPEEKVKNFKKEKWKTPEWTISFPKREQ